MSDWQDYTHYYRDRPASIVGTLRVHPNFHSPELNNKRDIVVYVPPSYYTGKKHYPVLYMHDGQNLFDNHASFAGEWCVDETMERLAKEGLEALIVAIPNVGFHRLAEYSPFLDKKLGGGRGRDYISFIANTLKPIIDRDARTLPDPAHTGIMGSSMGGLISLYAFFYRSDVFGFAGIMSPSIWYADGAILQYIKEDAHYNPGRIYLDTGRKEYADLGDPDNKRSRFYTGRIRRLKRILVRKGYNSMHQLKYLEEEEGRHEEAAWRRRLEGALRFFLQDHNAVVLNGKTTRLSVK